MRPLRTQRSICFQRLSALLGQGVCADGCCGLRGGRITIVIVDLAPEVGLQQYVRVKLRSTFHLRPALLDRHEALAYPFDGLDRYQKMLVTDAQVPADRDVQEAQLPVDLVD